MKEAKGLTFHREPGLHDLDIVRTGGNELFTFGEYPSILSRIDPEAAGFDFVLYSESASYCDSQEFGMALAKSGGRIEIKEETMRQRTLMLTIVALLILGVASFGIAQMMGGGHGHMSKSDSSSQSVMMDKKMMKNMGSMMNNMMQHCQMMSNDFGELESHFEKMMQMDDMGELRSEMQKHHEMMQGMHKNMMEQQEYCQEMRTIMHSESMQGMMDTGSSESGESDHHSDDY